MHVMHDSAAPYPGDLLEHLRGFVALCTRLDMPGPGAFERAARALHLDPSVLRRRMQALQGWVGHPLFLGRGARLGLSPAGARLRGRALAILGLVADLARDDAPPRLAVGCTGTILTELLPDVILQLERAHPGLRVAVRRVGSAPCLRLVEEGELDVGVVRAARAPRGFVATRLCPDRLWVAAPSGHPLLRAGRLDARRLAEEPLIVYGESSQTRGRVLSVLEPLGARVRVEVDGKSSAVEYVRRGLGVAFLSLLPRHTPPTRGVGLREVTSLFPRTSFWIVRRTGPAHPVAEEAAREMRAVLGAPYPVDGAVPYP
jgi:DNA-binding transcriptional LysR family regulator